MAYPKAKYRAATGDEGDMKPYEQKRHAYVSTQVFDEKEEKALGKEWVDHPELIGAPVATPAPIVEEEKPKAKAAK